MRVRKLSEIVDAATEEILCSDKARKMGIVLAEQISNGLCDYWAGAVVRRLPGATLFGEHGHCWVRYRGGLFDSDTSYEDLEAIEHSWDE